METFEHNEKIKIQLQAFTRQLNADPNPTELEKTPDGRASFLPISFVEMTLDEIFFGQWEVSEINYSQIFNEVVGTGILTVWHPVTGRQLKRAGFGSVVITQDKDASIVDFNMTKKKNALDLAFPKLKAEITKNAAQTLGKIFGRDINRKQKDVFKPSLKELQPDAFVTLVKRVEAGEHTLIPMAESAFILSSDQKLILEGLNSQKQLSNG